MRECGRGTRVVAAGLLLVGVLLACAGCGERQESRSALEVKRQYAELLTEGAVFGLSGTVKAESYDPISLELRGVTLEEPDERIVRAERAELIVNVERDTIMMRLHEVTGADAELGRIVELEGLSTDEVALGYDVRP